VVIEAANAGRDTLDFGGMSTAVNVDLDSTSTRAVSPLLSLRLSNQGTVEDAIGSDFNDTLRGNALGNLLDGGLGDDTLEGRQGNDSLYGRGGNDTYVFNNTATGQDSLFEDEDNHGPTNDVMDRLDFTGMTAGVAVNLGSTATQQVNGSLSLILNNATGFEAVTGSAFNDVITGNSRANHLSGLGGNDTIYGKAGDDTIFGGIGNDTLHGDEGMDMIYGEAGNDTLRGGIDGVADRLFGGIGADLFIAEWYAVNNSKLNRELVMDFSSSQGDRVV
jgi:Ca2+-binding RTX toxin-like protein